MGIEVVLFDAAGTLIYLPRGVGFHYADVASRHGVALDPREVDTTFATVWRSMPPRAASSGPRPDDDRGWWQRLVWETLDRLRAPAFDRAAYFDELYVEFTLPGVWQLFPEVREVLSSLLAHMRLGIVSNFDRRLLPILAGLEIAPFFEHVVLSSEIGVDKPDPAIFRSALEQFGVGPERVIHVGDDPQADWQTARATGMHVFKLDRRVNDLHGVLRLIRA